MGQRLLLMSDAALRCQRRADMEGDSVIQPPEWKQLISEQYGHIYSTVVKAGMRHFESTQTITATGAASYSVATDHDETIGVDRVLDTTSGRKVELGELMLEERARFSGLTGDAIAYSLVAQTIVLYPNPSSGTYLHVYVPQAPDISALADTGTFDIVTADGEAFLYWGVAVKALAKRRQDPSLAILERDAAEQRFKDDVQMRALTNPRRRVVKSTPLDWNNGYGSFPGGGPDGWGLDPGGWWNR